MTDFLGIWLRHSNTQRSMSPLMLKTLAHERTKTTVIARKLKWGVRATLKKATRPGVSWGRQQRDSECPIREHSWDNHRSM
jgi:hypothetical protein